MGTGWEMGGPTFSFSPLLIFTVPLAGLHSLHTGLHARTECHVPIAALNVSVVSFTDLFTTV